MQFRQSSINSNNKPTSGSRLKSAPKPCALPAKPIDPQSGGRNRSARSYLRSLRQPLTDATERARRQLVQPRFDRGQFFALLVGEDRIDLAVNLEALYRQVGFDGGDFRRRAADAGFRGVLRADGIAQLFSRVVHLGQRSSKHVLLALQLGLDLRLLVLGQVQPLGCTLQKQSAAQASRAQWPAAYHGLGEGEGKSANGDRGGQGDEERSR